MVKKPENGKAPGVDNTRDKKELHEIIEESWKCKNVPEDLSNNSN